MVREEYKSPEDLASPTSRTHYQGEKTNYGDDGNICNCGRQSRSPESSVRYIQPPKNAPPHSAGKQSVNNALKGNG